MSRRRRPDPRERRQIAAAKALSHDDVWWTEYVRRALRQPPNFEVAFVPIGAPMSERVDLPNGEYLVLDRARSGACEVHTWPTAGLGRSLVHAMRLTHGKGGIDVCTGCLERAKQDAATRAGLVDVAAGLNGEQVRAREKLS